MKKLIVFDLDFTLWDCGGTWCDCTSPPYYLSNNNVIDSQNKIIRLFPEVKDILQKLKSNNIKIAIASRTQRPEWAIELLEKFDVKKYIDFSEIYPTEKTKHFKALYHKSGIEYKDMIFFDDEYRNIIDVKKLGVQCILVKNGVNLSLIQSFNII